MIKLNNHNKIEKCLPRGGVLDISLGGKVRPGPSYPDPFKTKIADFPTLFKTEFRFLIPIRRTYAQAVYRPRKDPLFKTRIDKIDTMIKTKNDKIDTLFNTKIPKKIPWLTARPH